MKIQTKYSCGDEVYFGVIRDTASWIERGVVRDIILRVHEGYAQLRYHVRTDKDEMYVNFSEFELSPTKEEAEESMFKVGILPYDDKILGQPTQGEPEKK